MSKMTLEDVAHRLHQLANGAGGVRKMTIGQLKRELRDLRDEILHTE